MKQALAHYHHLFADMSSSPIDAFASREQAWQDLEQMGLPTLRHESWKYTNLRALFKESYGLPQATATKNFPPSLFADCCDEWLIADGQLQSSAEQSVVFSSFDELSDELKKLFTQQFAQQNSLTRPFQALNQALCHQVWCLYIPEAAVIDKVQHLYFYQSLASNGIHYNHRLLIYCAKNSESTLLQSHLGEPTANYFNNLVSEIYLAEGANLRHCKYQDESKKSYHIAEETVRQQKNSVYQSDRVLLGGQLVRDDIFSALEAPGAEVILNGVYMMNDKQHVDTHTTIDHLVPNCQSTEFYKGIVADKARAVFNGKVIVHPGADKTLSAQSNMNLLLSAQAEVDTKPELEIYADDVKCSHGATVGELDSTQLFYLLSRGINEQEAKALLIYAFVFEVLAKMPEKNIHKKIEQIISQRLEQAMQST